jgi:hypothetical protein
MSHHRQLVIAGIQEVNYARLRECLAKGAVTGSVQISINQITHYACRSTWFGLSEEVTKTFDVILSAWSETDKGTVDDFLDYFVTKFIMRPNASDYYNQHVYDYQMRVYNWCRTHGAHKV